MTDESLFHEACALPAAKRRAFLDARCAGHPELRAAVERLLAAYDATGEFLDQPAAGVSGLLTLDSGGGAAMNAAMGRGSSVAGDVIGDRYTLSEKIGEGGMGEVWVAKQTEPIKRKVALKLIKSGMNSKAVLARFEQERHALALMDHPSIARVLDGGLTPAGQPYFVMELVNGLPLTKYCDEARLTSRQRLELFGLICQAIQHAHQKGIVHRDLKPENILVTLIDGKPVPKVIDFGIAKATTGKLTDVTLDTQFGSIVGTIEYMAPEQAGLSGEDIDTRADIYSLGVILYELLTGLRPIDGQRLKEFGAAGTLPHHQGGGSVKAQHALLRREDDAVSGGAAANEPAGADGDAARRTGLGGDEVPGEEPRPALRIGGQPASGHPAISFALARRRATAQSCVPPPEIP